VIRGHSWSTLQAHGKFSHVDIEVYESITVLWRSQAGAWPLAIPCAPFKEVGRA